MILPLESKKRLPVRFRSTLKAFTLVEIIVCIAIVGVLASLLYPTVETGIQSAKGAKCLSNMKLWIAAVPMYASDNNGTLPPTVYTGNSSGETIIPLAPYAGAPSLSTSNAYFTWGTQRECPCYGSGQWMYGFNSYMSAMKLGAFQKPAHQVYITDLAVQNRWITAAVLSAGQGGFKGNVLKYANPRPHLGKVSVMFLDGHAALSRVSALTWDQFTANTASYEASQAGVAILPAAQDLP